MKGIAKRVEGIQRSVSILAGGPFVGVLGCPGVKRFAVEWLFTRTRRIDTTRWLDLQGTTMLFDRWCLASEHKFAYACLCILINTLLTLRDHGT